MNKRNLLSILMLFLAATAVTVKTYAEEVEQTIQLSVQPFVSVERQEGSIDTAEVNGQTGVHTGLRTVYNVSANGSDEDYDFVIQATTVSTSGEVDAYGPNGSLLFGKVLTPPTETDINDAKAGGNNNKNVIAYPTTASITSPMTISFEQNYKTYGNCYVIRINDGETATLTHNVQGTPVSGTYLIGQDDAGAYQATIMLSVNPKG